MEHVYIVTAEGGAILGVFLNEEDAEECADDSDESYEVHIVEEHYNP